MRAAAFSRGSAIILVALCLAMANGLSLGASQALLLKKIEELTLYVIEMQRENEALKERVNKMEEK